MFLIRLLLDIFIPQIEIITIVGEVEVLFIQKEKTAEKLIISQQHSGVEYKFQASGKFLQRFISLA